MYEHVKFCDLTDKRKETVREKIAQLWAEGLQAEQIAKKVKLSKRSVAAAIGNYERLAFPATKVKKQRKSA